MVKCKDSRYKLTRIKKETSRKKERDIYRQNMYVICPII